jgi:hypothetical protein
MSKSWRWKTCHAQTKRLARWRIRRDNMPTPSSSRRSVPARRRKRKIHPIDEILADCHVLAWDAMAPDTS